jgi:hypothetical protein
VRGGVTAFGHIYVRTVWHLCKRASGDTKESKKNLKQEWGFDMDKIKIKIFRLLYSRYFVWKKQLGG